MKLIAIKFMINPQSFYKILIKTPLLKPEKDKHSSKSLYVYGESQSCMGRQQAQKTALLQTWTISNKIGGNSEDGARSPEGRVKCHREYFQGIELCFNQVADDMCRADFIIAMALYVLLCKSLFLNTF